MSCSRRDMRSVSSWRRNGSSISSQVLEEVGGRRHAPSPSPAPPSTPVAVLILWQGRGREARGGVLPLPSSWKQRPIPNLRSRHGHPDTSHSERRTWTYCATPYRPLGSSDLLPAPPPSTLAPIPPQTPLSLRRSPTLLSARVQLSLPPCPAQPPRH